MNQNTDLKSRLAAELAGVIYGDKDVPETAWRFIDDAIDENFGGWKRQRLGKLLQDVEAVRCSVDDPTPNDIWGASGSSQRTDADWMTFRGVVDACASALLNIKRADTDGDRLVFETASHGR